MLTGQVAKGSRRLPRGDNPHRPHSRGGFPPVTQVMIENQFEEGDGGPNRHLGSRVAGKVVEHFLKLRGDAGKPLPDESLMILLAFQAQQLSG